MYIMPTIGSVEAIPISVARDTYFENHKVAKKTRTADGNVKGKPPMSVPSVEAAPFPPLNW